MLDRLDSALRFQQQALSLLTKRQDVLAANIANADTPGYLARDIDFSRQLKDSMDKNRPQNSPVSLTLTSGAHIPGRAPAFDDGRLMYRIPDQPSADGNTVDMDRERVNYADNSVKYESSLTLLGAQIQNMMTAIGQG